MQNISEIARANEEELLVIAKQRIEKFSILKRIYDDAFLSILVRHKSDLDNHLLVWLVIDNPFDKHSAIRFFQDIDENLDLLQHEGGIQKFKPKLRQWNTIPFESAIAELEFAAEYKKRGFQIELEPRLPNGEKGDFLASKDSVKIYFEVKCIFWERSLKDHAIINEISERFSRLNQAFVIGIDIKEIFQRKQTVKVVKYIQEKLKQFERTSFILPFSFVYPESGEPIIEIDIIKRLSNGEKGYVSGAVFGGGVKVNWNDLRSKISSGVSQLHPDHAGVLVIQPHGLETVQYDIENALFGDLAVTKFGDPKPLWQKDRIFYKNKNKRLSAVIYCKKRLYKSGYIREQIVYHNPYAKTRLSASTFSGEYVTQFIPTQRDDGKLYYKKITG